MAVASDNRHSRK